MRGWVTAALVLSLLPSSPAAAQCGYSREYSGAYRSSYLDLALDGSQLWAATGSGVTLFDVAADAPRALDSIALPGLTRLVRTRAGIGYAASGSTIYVLRRPARELEIAATVDAGATINDLEISGSTLIAATSNGVATFDAAVTATPPLTRYAGGKEVFSVAVVRNTLYAADGDNSIDAFSLTSASGLAPLVATVRPLSLNVSDGVLYASDGQQSDVFSGPVLTLVATIPYGTTSLASIANSVAFAAGSDRQFHALDVSALGAPVELFDDALTPSGGTINRIAALQAAGARLYVAGGDGGLTTYDVSSFAPPFAVRSYRVAAATSVAADGSLIFVGTASGITQLHQSRAGELTLDRTWARSAAHTVHDVAANFLLTSSGATVTEWTLAASTPISLSSATFRAPVAGAVLRGNTAYVALVDGSLWSADLTQPAPSPVRIQSAPVAYIARSGENIATAETTESGTTVVRLFSGGDFASPPAAVTVAGATTTLDLAGSRAALFTFEGIVIVDFVAGSQFVLPSSKNDVIRDIALSGSTLVAVSGASATIWNTLTRRPEKTLALPAEAVAVRPLDASTAAVATADGVIALNGATPSQQPAATATLGGNKYYRKAVSGRDRLYLFDGRTVDVFGTHFAGAPQFVTAVSVPGAVDLAASDAALFVLSGSGALAQYSAGGALQRTTQISAGSDATPLSVFAVGGAPWVSLSTGCVTTGCEKRTFVYDPVSLAQTASMPGGVIAVAVSGSRAYALFDLPRETRGYSISDPVRPSLVASRPSETTAAAIGYGGGTVTVLGDRLYRYDEAALTKVGEDLAPVVPRGFAGVIVDGSCTLMAGRSASVDVLNGLSFGVPGIVRSMTGSDGRYFVLTDYSLETLSRAAAPRAARRRAAQ